MYRVYKGSKTDTKKYRVFVIVSRQILLVSQYSTVICAPAYSNYNNLSTQVKLGVDHGLKHESAIHCDELISIPKNKLKHFVGVLPQNKVVELDSALKISLALEPK